MAIDELKSILLLVLAGFLGLCVLSLIGFFLYIMYRQAAKTKLVRGNSKSDLDGFRARNSQLLASEALPDLKEEEKREEKQANEKPQTLFVDVDISEQEKQGNLKPKTLFVEVDISEARRPLERAGAFRNSYHGRYYRGRPHDTEAQEGLLKSARRSW